MQGHMDIPWSDYFRSNSSDVCFHVNLGGGLRPLWALNSITLNLTKENTDNSRLEHKSKQEVMSHYTDAILLILECYSLERRSTTI